MVGRLKKRLGGKIMRYLLSSILAIIFALFLLQHPMSAQDYGISGTWYYGSTPTHIRVEFKNRIVLDNGEGSTATGYFTDPWHIKVPQWNVNGQITHNGRRISWSNGTTWTRYRTPYIPLEEYDGRPTSIEVYDNGWRFTIINEQGQRSDGRAQSPRVLYIPSLNLTGYINADATRIRWTNGTVWTRSPDANGGGRGPLSSPAQ